MVDFIMTEHRRLGKIRFVVDVCLRSVIPINPRLTVMSSFKDASLFRYSMLKDIPNPWYTELR